VVCEPLYSDGAGNKDHPECGGCIAAYYLAAECVWTDMKVLNLYSGIGGNRRLWQDVEVTAVEYNQEIATIYSDYFPQDKMIIADAHEYLLQHYKEFDFIWSSPPCQTHSRARYWKSKSGAYAVKYPDMILYQEIIFLTHYFSGKWCIENVMPFYKPLIAPTKEMGRHLIWANFKITDIEIKQADIHKGTRSEWSALHGFDLDGYKLSTRKDQIYRNCVHPETGLHILNCCRGIISREVKQVLLF
jgi:DNA (cytosine-5)-methyltransferase 1